MGIGDAIPLPKVFGFLRTVFYIFRTLLIFDGIARQTLKQIALSEIQNSGPTLLR